MSTDLELYGRNLTGTETDLEKSKLARAQYLKTKMRTKLAGDMGDTDDNVADLTRACVLGMAIRAGLVTDDNVKTRYGIYVQDMLADYGGAESIMDVLEYDKTCVEQHVVAGYYLAKQMIEECENEACVMAVDLPGEPVSEGME
jgi:hypothetical protein